MKICRFCEGSGFEDNDKMKNVRFQGFEQKQLAEIIDYAFEHGYKTNEMKQLNELVVMS